MKASQFFISTLKEAPAEAALASHKLMIRAGLIKANASGLYTWMPMGLRVLRKVENIVREEMARAGSVELLMPVVQPAELWQESGRWEFYGKELLRLKDRHDRDFCMGPTCEEVIADIVRKEINSYKQLPKNFYHIQTKFRDEVRPRFGVMRAREFVMKDAYSFHADYASLQTTYQDMYDAYCRIFTRLGLEFRPVAADTGSIGGTGSHEFQVLAESGEDVIAYSDTSDYAANIELAPTLPLKGERAAAQAELTKVHTPNVKTIESLVEFLNIPVEQTLKSIVVEGENEGELVLLLLRGDHEFNDIKAEKLAGVKSPLTMASPAAIVEQFGANGGSLGPVNFKGKVYADFATEKGADWVIGANEDDYHYTGFNFGRDADEPEFVDLRNVIEGDISPDEQGRLKEHLSARGAKQFPESTDVHFELPHLVFFQEGSRLYDVGSDEAVYNTQTKQLLFKHNVVLTKAADAKRQAGVVKTDLLHVDTESQYAQTDTPVTFQYGESSGNAEGLTYDHKKGLLNFPSRVKATIYDTKNM